MKTKRIKIEGIPATVWGEGSDRVWIAVHGNLSHKEDEVVRLLAETATERGYEVLSFDLPEHGERKGDPTYLCKVQNCVRDLKTVLAYAKANFREMNLWACSMGAYFSLLAYRDEPIEKCLFLSPVVDMLTIIENLMAWSCVTESMLQEKREIQTDFGQTLYWDYYEYVKENPSTRWDKPTSILYGSRDMMQAETIVRAFAKEFGCALSILKNGEHFFHTQDQLDCYQAWLRDQL